MDVAELERMLADLESDRAERKESISDMGKIKQAICAFANDLPGHGVPGYLFVGVNDAGRPTGLPVTDELLLSLASIRSDGTILPFPAMNVQQAILRGYPVAVVEVFPSDSPPVRYDGRVWVRVGPRRAQATAEEERRLTERRKAGNLTFDQQPVRGATLTALNERYFQSEYLPATVAPEVLAENARSLTDQMASLRFLSADRQTPTVAGVLMLGKDTLAWLPGAYVQFTRFDGGSLADPVIHHKTITGTLAHQAQQILDLLDLQSQVRAEMGADWQRRDIADYPAFALRELALNALLHRTYESTNAPVRINWFADRVEFQSPGGLYGIVTPENFDHTTDYRNPVLAEAFKALGYVERFGVGIQRVRQSLAQNGNPPPEFTFEPSQVRVTILRRPSS